MGKKQGREKTQFERRGTTEDTSTGGEPSEDTGGESSVEPMLSISREEFQRAQKEDANLHHMWHEAVNNEGDYCVRHGLLMRRWKSWRKRNLEERPLEGEPESLSLVVPAGYKEEERSRLRWPFWGQEDSEDCCRALLLGRSSSRR